VVGALGRSLFMEDLAIGQIAAWGVTSQLLILVILGDSVYCRSTFWIPGVMPQLSEPPFKLQKTI
jgi:hypothetical protein